MDVPKKNKITEPNVALTKAESFCAYQERSQQEVRDKLYDWGLWSDAIEQIISQLIEGNFLNEERFAKAMEQLKQKGIIPSDDRIFVKDRQQYHFISWSKVHLIESMDNYARLYFEDKYVFLKSSLNQL